MEDDEMQEETKSESSNFIPWAMVGLLSVLLLLSIGVIVYLLNGNVMIDPETNKTEEPQQLSSLKIPSPTQQPTTAQTKTIQLNKTFQIPLNDGTSETLSTIAYTIESYERSKDVEIAGGSVKTITGKELFVVYVQLTNDFNQAIEIMAGDYIRLSVNGEDKWMAPEFHSDPVEVRAKSSRNIRMAFTINQSDTNLRLQVGELEGEKEIINLDKPDIVEIQKPDTQSPIKIPLR